MLVLMLGVPLPPGVTAAPRPGATRAARASTVLVRSTSEGARIFVDGEQVGTVPQRLPMALSPGTHTIKVSKAGHADYLDTFELKRGQDLVLEIDLLALAGVLQVDASVPDAIVAVDQRQIGQVPFEGEIEPGHHVLEVRAPEHSTFKQELEVIAGEPYTFNVQLVPLPVGDPGEAGGAWYGYWWVWAGAAVLVGGGVTAAVLLTRSEAPSEPRNQVPLNMLR